MGPLKIADWLRRPSTGGALVVALASFVFWALPLGRALERMSFDLLTVLSPSRGFPELVLVELDETSHQELGQDYGKPWNRRLHAGLVNYLRTAGARSVVFDVEFYEQGDDKTATTELATALHAHGRIVLAASLVHIGKPGFGGTAIRPPLPELLGTGVTWGVSWSLPGPKGEEDGVVRMHPRGREPDASLPWVAAAAVEAEVTRSGVRPEAERWVRHYGPPGTLPRVSYWLATNEPPQSFLGKTVFVGGRPGTGFVRQEGDQFRTPWSQRDGSPVSGLELTATAWLNLVRGDWLTRASPGAELLGLLLCGAMLGGMISNGSAWRVVLVTVVFLFVVPGAAVWLFNVEKLWCDWAMVALVQLPAALAWRAVNSFRQLRREKEWLEAPLQGLFPESTLAAVTPQSTPAPSDSRPTTIPQAAAGTPPIPEYQLLRCVGRGAYGEVWLARDVLGGFRAIKIVRRVAFDDDGPYEREFRGLQKFAPISREHPGLVQVLHVGLDRPGGFFYYVMEAGDDEETGQHIHPDHYAPRNLGRDLRLRRPLNAIQVAQLGLALCDALEFLHDRGLIHRDIKPANVIFAGGRPKLADVGLVTDLGSRLGAVSQVGTEGYIPPEGCGTAAGDIFALGCLLAETLERTQAEGIAAVQAKDALCALSARAHEPEVSKRFASARAMKEALLEWQNKYLPTPSQSA